MSDFTVQRIRLDEIDIPREDYQRELTESRAVEIARDFDPALCGLLLVARRGDRWVVIDGQHRLRALRILGLEDWLCAVTNAETVRDEAKQFAKANTARVRVSAWNLYRARLAAGDDVIVNVQSVCDSLGITVGGGGDHAAKPRKTRSVGALERVYRSGGADHLASVIRVCVTAWPGDSRHLEADLLLGMSSFLLYYGGHAHFNRARAAEKFSRVELTHLRQRGKALGGGVSTGSTNTFGNNPGLVKALVEAYNWRLRSNELPEPTASGWKRFALQRAKAA